MRGSLHRKYTRIRVADFGNCGSSLKGAGPYEGVLEKRMLFCVCPGIWVSGAGEGKYLREEGGKVKRAKKEAPVRGSFFADEKANEPVLVPWMKSDICP